MRFYPAVLGARCSLQLTNVAARPLPITLHAMASSGFASIDLDTLSVGSVGSVESLSVDVLVSRNADLQRRLDDVTEALRVSTNAAKRWHRTPAAVDIQRLVRGAAGRAVCGARKGALVVLDKLKSSIRSKTARHELVSAVAAATKLQAFLRRFPPMKLLDELKRQAAALAIEARWRSVASRTRDARSIVIGKLRSLRVEHRTAMASKESELQALKRTKEAESKQLQGTIDGQQKQLAKLKDQVPVAAAVPVPVAATAFGVHEYLEKTLKEAVKVEAQQCSGEKWYQAEVLKMNDDGSCKVYFPGHHYTSEAKLPQSERSRVIYKSLPLAQIRHEQ